ncbi:hypothetical protein [Nocardiopsis halophila]|uniref:hypothetical protein n=1 Tax=Nocardiopsis halophila TaxID=141692 RepID=UPI00034B7104|nr:hypothetical protein [Nocardiopsis halophila]
MLPFRRHGLSIATEDVIDGRAVQVRPRLGVDDVGVMADVVGRTDHLSVLPDCLRPRSGEGCAKACYGSGRRHRRGSSVA